MGTILVLTNGSTLAREAGAAGDAAMVAAYATLATGILAAAVLMAARSRARAPDPFQASASR